MHPLTKAVLTLSCIAIGALAWVGIETGLILHRSQPAVALVNTTIDVWFNCKKNPACLTSDALGTFKALEKAAGQSYRASLQAEKAATEVTLLVQTTHSDLHSILVQALGLTQDLRTDLSAILHDADKAVRDGDQVLQTANQTLLPLQETLQNIDALTKTLNAQITSGAPEATKTVESLNQAVQHFDALLTDPDIQRTLANVASTTGHIDGASESVDIALRPWRRRAGMLKTIVLKAVDLIKFTMPIK